LILAAFFLKNRKPISDIAKRLAITLHIWRGTKKQLVTAGAHGLTRSLKRHKKKYRREYETSCFNLFYFTEQA
jgi:hypothetical protein